MRALIALTAAVALLLPLSGSVAASCAPPAAVAENGTRAVAVVHGTVTGTGPGSVTLRVDRVLKGSVPNTLTVFIGPGRGGMDGTSVATSVDYSADGRAPSRASSLWPSWRAAHALIPLPASVSRVGADRARPEATLSASHGDVVCHGGQESITRESIISETMARFIGRRSDLAALDDELARVRKTGEGSLITIRGRRRVGKSRLIEHWLEQRKLRHVFFSVPAAGATKDLELLRESVASSTLPVAPTVAGITFTRWQSALTLLASGATKSKPLVLVIDEFPYLLDRQEGKEVESGVQHAWDRSLERLPVFLILIGSDTSMMERLATHGSPLFGRPTREMRVDPMTPSELMRLLKLSPVDALDAYLAVGGFPGVVKRWAAGTDLWAFLAGAISDPDSSLIVNGERILSAEFPTDLHARAVLSAVGSGERTFTNILKKSGLPRATLDRSLRLLTVEKRVVAAPTPLSARSSSEKRYLVSDSYLRFWLRFIGPAMPEIERGRSRIVLDGIRRDWAGYRGRAVEPLVREAIARLLPHPRFGDAKYVGGYWTRTNVPEVDLAGAVSERPKRVAFIGSIKWREDAAFDDADLRHLASLVPQVPGTDASTRLVAVARKAVRAKVDVALTAADVIAAWG